MRILFLTHAFNSLTQRLYVELTRLGHQVDIEFDIKDSVTIEAVEQAKPDLIIAPFLKRAIPEAVWKNHVCLVVHPGPEGDRGPSSLDWAILDGKSQWGVTVLQADAEMDGGPVWESRTFAVGSTSKSSLYRNQVSDAALDAVLACVARFPDAQSHPALSGPCRPLCRQADRALDWATDDTAAVLRKIASADGNPGLLATLAGREVYLYDAHPAHALEGEPGSLIAQGPLDGHGALAVATQDGAVWIGHMRAKGDAFKLPARMVLPADGLPEVEAYPDIRYEEVGDVGYLHFAFYNGAMSTDQCRRLLTAYETAKARPTRVIVLMGGPDYWSNGIHLNVIEAADSPADESWRNINAMNDLARAVITTESHRTVAVMQGNAGAGGVFLALAADDVWARGGVVLNPHYKGMGNLYGSEYWTYLLPRRAGEDAARRVTQARLPVGAEDAREMGLLDRVLPADRTAFLDQVRRDAAALAADPALGDWLAEKRRRRAADEAAKPLDQYRAEELARMTLNFYGFDPSYHVARYHFVNKLPKARTPLYLAGHRNKLVRRP